MTTNNRSPQGLLGRRNESQALDDLLAGVQGGLSATVVLHGEAGVGKTALLEYVQLRASGCGARTAGPTPGSTWASPTSC
ncbi:AAA family ATPase [Jiangella aurantiaca]|nr:ATP-binding protein [Jiangella aurantiaca]